MANTVATSNNVNNVSSAKGVAGGYIFSAPVGTTLPTDIKTTLDPAFKVLGSARTATSRRSRAIPRTSWT